MHVNVVVCSRNRVDSLLETIQSLFAMDVPAGVQCGIVVVDNGSTDGTLERLRRIEASAPMSLEILVEPQRGKAFALNRALRSAGGEVILFTDDDALVDRNWLASTLHAFSASGADCVGGRVVPLWLIARPEWLTDRFLNVLAMLDLGEEARELATELLYGVNYAFRRDVFERIGEFNTRLCARGCGSEDAEMIERLRHAGGRIWYAPNMLVRHKVFPDRVTRTYFRQWHRFNGRDRAELMVSGATVFGLEGYMLRAFANALIRLVRATAEGDLGEKFSQELSCRFYWSYIGARFRQFATGRVPNNRCRDLH